MRYLLFNIEGHRTSGVGTFCRRLTANLNEFYTVSLDTLSSEKAYKREIAVGKDDSHDPDRVIQAVLSSLQPLEIEEKEWLICPNVGDVCFQASILLRSELLRRGAKAVSILGICHSDDVNQYRVLKHYDAELDGLMAVSTFIARRLSEQLPRWSKQEMEVLDYPIPMELPERGTQYDEERLQLIYSGRLENDQKRIVRLPQVVEKLLRSGCPFRITIVGDGSQREAIESAFEALGERYGWNDWVFTGALETEGVLGHLAEADIALLVSEYEGTPLSLLESMAMGVLPVIMEVESIATGSVGGQVVSVPQGDVGGMAEKIASLGSDRKRLKNLAGLAQECVLETHSVARCASQLRKAGSASFVFSKERGVREDKVRGIHDRELHQLVERVQELGEEEKIAVFGAGQFGRKLVSRISEVPHRISLWVDSDARKWGVQLDGHWIEDPRSLVDAKCDCILLGSESFALEMRIRVEEIYRDVGVECPRLIFV